MSRQRIALLSLVAVFAASMLSTAVASAAGPFWHVNGTKLAEGSIKQLNLQLKGKAILKSKITLLNVTLECEVSTSEGAAIENVAAQGQDKGRLTFSTCKQTGLGANCEVVKPITTNNTKSHLVTFKGAQSKYADLFEPQQGETFAQVVITKTTAQCSAEGTFPVKGTVAAEIVPKEQEVQDGLLNFPAVPIAVVFLGQEEKTVGLKLGAETATFTAAYGAKLATGEKWGVFGQ